MFTVAELAEKLRRSRSKTYDLIKKGKIGFYRLDGAIFVTQADIDAYLASCRVEPRQRVKTQRVLKHLTLD